MRYTRTSFGWFIYNTWASMIIFCISLLRNQGSPCLLKCSLAYIFRGLPINMQYARRVCGKIVSSYRNFLCTAGKMGSETLIMLTLPAKRIDSLRKHYTGFLLVTRKRCYGENWESIFCSKRLNDEVPAIFSNLEPGAQPKLEHAYKYFRSKWRIRIAHFSPRTTRLEMNDRGEILRS